MLGSFGGWAGVVSLMSLRSTLVLPTRKAGAKFVAAPQQYSAGMDAKIAHCSECGLWEIAHYVFESKIEGAILV
jgi:hypothetical protein